MTPILVTGGTGLLPADGPFETCRAALTMSVDRGRPEVAGLR